MLAEGCSSLSDAEPQTGLQVRANAKESVQIHISPVSITKGQEVVLFFCLSCLKNRNSEFTVIKLHFMSFVLKFDKPKQLLFSKLIPKEVQCFHRVEDLSNRVILIDEVLIEQV